MMTTILFSFLLLLPLSKTLALTNEEASPILKEFIKTEFRILEIREAPLEGFWEVVTEIGQERRILYIHKNLRFVIHGQILDRQVKRNITLDRLKEFRKVNISTLPLENAIPMGQGKRKLYVFTDPQCHFCFQLHEELKRINDLQTFFFLYPLTPASYEKAKAIWCSQSKLKALEEAYEGKELKSLSCDTSPIDKNIQLGKRLLIESTPTLLFQNGKMVEGYMGLDTLENLLTLNSNF
ncbi:MAG: disulfide bond isomerase, DsbC/G [Deltaproteobacteria bacterium]|nr:disulfide bond isomerase, DsbC/G [Deltaproteobacteria bacterium]